MKATNMIGSALMSSEVASMAISENKQKGYSDIGATSLGLIRGAVEYATEALGGEWVIKNIKANPLNFVKSMLLNMIPEGTEEVMSSRSTASRRTVSTSWRGMRQTSATGPSPWSSATPSWS